MKLHRFALAVTAALALAGSAAAQVATAPVVHRANGQDTIATPVLPVKPDGSFAEAGANYTGAVTVVPTITAGTAYASGQSVGGLLTFANVLRAGQTSGMVQGVNVRFKSAQSAPLDLVLFSASPTATTIADRTAFSLAAADFAKVVGVVHVSDCTSLGTPSLCQANGLALSVVVPSGQALYGALVTRGTPTYSAADGLSVQLVAVQD